MKRIKLLLIATCALTLALPLAGCMHGDSGNANNGVEQKIETQMDENEDCPDGECPDDKDCPDGKCPRNDSKDCPDGNCDKLPEGRNGRCPDGRCPAKLLPPVGRHGNGHIPPVRRMH